MVALTPPRVTNELTLGVVDGDEHCDCEWITMWKYSSQANSIHTALWAYRYIFFGI